MRCLLLLALLAGTAHADIDADRAPSARAAPSPRLDPPQLDQPRTGSPDPASTTVPPQDPPTERVFDSRDNFDSRRNTYPFGMMLETQISHVFGGNVGALSATFAAPFFAQRFGRLRISLGTYVGDEESDPFEENYDPQYLRIAVGWERWAFCIRRTVCPGVAADVSYAFVDPLDGTLITPHAFIDLKTKRAHGLGIRLGGGPTILMATKTDGGRERFDLGFSVYVNFAVWAAY